MPNAVLDRIDQFAQTGYTGLVNLNGLIDTGETLNEFQVSARYETINRMRNDDNIKGIEKAFFTPLIKAKLSLSYENQELENNEFYREQIEFIRMNLRPETMRQYLQEAVLSIPNGIYIHEMTFRPEGDKVILDKLSPRPPSTVYYWHTTSHGEISGIEQYVYVKPGDKAGVFGTEGGAYEYVYIPRSKLVINVHGREGGKVLGTPEYRAYYRPWVLKDHALKQLAIAIERTGAGIPVAVMSEDITDINDAQVTAVKDVLKSMQSSERAYAVFTGVKEVKLLAVDANAVEKINDTVSKFDEAMQRAALVMIMGLSTSNHGSRAVGDSFERVFANVSESLAEELALTITQEIIKPIIDYNFGKQQFYPQASLRTERDIDSLYRLLAELKKAGLIRGNEEIENDILTEIGMPLTTDDNALDTESQSDIIPIAAEKCTCHTIDLQAGKQYDYRLGRQLKSYELAAGFDTILKDLNNLKDTFSKGLRAIVQPAIIEAAKELKTKKIFQIELFKKATWGNRVADYVRTGIEKVRDVAKTHVAKELKKRGAPITLTADKKSVKKFIESKPDAISEYLRFSSTGALLNYYEEGIAQGLVAAALTDYIIDKIKQEVGQRYDKYGSEITGAYAQAREIEAEEFKSMIKSKIRTEVMDTNTCEWCSQYDGREYTLDGDVWIDAAGEEAWPLPDPNCEGMRGGNQCRGVYLYTF